MKVAGGRDLLAVPQRVWDALTDPRVLTGVVPGCHDVRAGEPTTLSADWRVAALDGTYLADVAVDDAEPPNAATLRISARGDPGALDAVVRATLHDHDGGTRLEWEVSCDAAGQLGAIGARVLEAAVRRQADALFDRLAAHLNGPAPPADAAAAPAAPMSTRPPAWGPFEDGPRAANGDRVVLAALAGSLVTLAAVWLVWRLRGRR